MDMAYGSRVICRIENWSNALSYEVQALIRRISFAGYGVLVQTRGIWKVQRVEAVSRESDWENRMYDTKLSGKDQEDGNDVDARDQETKTPDLTDYQLVRDREPRTRTKPLSSAILHRSLEEVIYMRQPPGNEQGLEYWNKSSQPCGHNMGCVVSRKEMLQHVVALVTTECEVSGAPYIAVKEAIWLRGLLEELGVELNIVVVNCDNQSAVHLSWNHVFHEMTKHINVRYHLIRAVLEAKTVKVQHNNAVE
ncbi:hypothetical protein Tco_1146130 [Tanacetum coccineum]